MGYKRRSWYPQLLPNNFSSFFIHPFSFLTDNNSLRLFLAMPRVYNWDSYHETLGEMYLLHDMHLKDIMTEMSTHYNFTPRLVTLIVKESY